MKNKGNAKIDLETVQVVLDAMPQIAYVFNKDKKLIMWNKNTEVILGYSADELYLKNVFDFVEEETVDINEEAFREIFDNKEKQIIEQNLIAKSGKKIPILDTANYVMIGGDEYLIGLSIDISEKRKAENKLKRAVIELQRLKNELQIENYYLKDERSDTNKYRHILGESDLIKDVKHQLEQVAATSTNVLITGEMGTHKELFARTIHDKSDRRNRNFIKVDCSKASSKEIEHRLFGEHTDDSNQFDVGRIKFANQGTMFLYEVGELPMSCQSKLYNVLSEGLFENFDSSNLKRNDIRVIASTKHDLKELITKNLFREDLYYLLNSYPISIPPLRDRIHDIPLLANYFLDKYNQKIGKEIKKISKKTIEELKRYGWPGNIREMENIIERGVVISNGSLLKLESVLEVEEIESDSNLLSLAEYEKKYILKVLNKTYWRIDGPKGAALILGMHPETLRSRMRKFAIIRPE